MRVLMLGWEFPPLYSGGLGVVTKKLAWELAKQDVEVVLAIPQFVRQQVADDDIPDEFDLADLSPYQPLIEVQCFDTLINGPYDRPDQYQIQWQRFHSQAKQKSVYGKDLWLEMERFATQVCAFAADQSFDLIHAHDWITFIAAVRLKQQTHLPLTVHIHATEIDRTGGNPHPTIFHWEQQGMQQADQVMAVSGYTRQILLDQYHIDESKITVVHNALRTTSHHDEELPVTEPVTESSTFTVLFIGRVTLQKGPDYFVEVAQRVVQQYPHIRFVLVGTGDMLPLLIEKIAAQRLQHHIRCIGFMNNIEKRRAFAQSDVCIVPSISEPFGLTVLEAVEYGLPVILSKTVGAQEVLTNALKVDYWDVDKMAHFVVALAKYPALYKTLSTRAYRETRSLSWEQQAEVVRNQYLTLLDN